VVGIVGRWKPVISLRSVALCVVSALLLVGAIALSQNSVSAANKRPLQVWLLPLASRGTPAPDRAELGLEGGADVSGQLVVSVSGAANSVDEDRWVVTLPPGALWSRVLVRHGSDRIVVKISTVEDPGKIVRSVFLAARKP
jgi:hypothetical protein